MPDKSYTLPEIQAATGIPVAQLRYALDQALLPRLRQGRVIGSRGRGVPRSFTTFEAFGLAAAALLRAAGLRRQRVRTCMDLLCESPIPGRRNLWEVPLYRAFEQRETAHLEIGDGANIRLTGSKNNSKPFLSNWRQIDSGAELADNYEPMVVLRINASKLRGLLK